MKRYLIAVLALLLLVSTADARYCNSPYCAMCNRLFGPMPGYGGQYSGYTSPNYVTKSKPVTKTVKPIKKSAVVTFEGPLAKPKTATELSFDPTPVDAIDKILQIINPQKDEVVYDVGCGDGRVLIAAAKHYGCSGLGMEINKDTAKLAQSGVNSAGFESQIRIVNCDSTKMMLDKADIIYMYLYPPVIEKLSKSMSSARVVISYYHDIPQLKTKKLEFETNGRKHVFYYWVNPNR